MGRTVGSFVGKTDGTLLGTKDGDTLGNIDGFRLGSTDGNTDGTLLGTKDGDTLGNIDGFRLGLAVGSFDFAKFKFIDSQIIVGPSVMFAVGSIACSCGFSVSFVQDGSSERYVGMNSSESIAVGSFVGRTVGSNVESNSKECINSASTVLVGGDFNLIELSIHFMMIILAKRITVTMINL